ncbi:hypothetical protein [Bacillus sp. S/N-304-OC-R1]|uniref:YphA family membrane protein n=1 Tax=Bacillus sp. S/N-304-OC-R1 TaxID=2758034 RepID=UPI001C8D20A1|nr:hypothetical protein [Bacillus sp. S/N-304-OC-R1]MBY0122576.1 hypothetical protein [Bacillus sp. S/N-304-OC-R1]
MEGLTFYWITWIYWVISTFFMKKGSLSRFYLSLWILMLIIISPYSFSLYDFEISFASIMLLVTLFLMVSTIKSLKAAYVLLSSFIIMLAYVCFHLFELFDPVLLIFPRNWMLAILLISLTFILQANKLYRFIILILGSIQGEFLYAYILNKYSFPFLIGSYAYLDAIALSTALAAAWTSFEYLTSFYEKHLNQIEKEKQKLS